MVYAIYIAAAAAIGLLIGFVALSVAWLKKTVLLSIRSKTVGLMSVYDELLEEKSRALESMRTESAAAAAAPQGRTPSSPTVRPAAETDARTTLAAFGVAERMGAAVYRDGAVGSVYRTIRRNFSFRIEELLPGLDGVTSAAPGPAGRLLEDLDWDTVYQLSTLSPEDQLSILESVLPEDAMALVDGYMSRAGRFHALEFYEELRAAADAEPKPARLRVPADMADGGRRRAGWEVVPDESICEGFQLEADNLLYDYCIKTRELS